MKKITLVSLFLLAALYVSAAISWMGNHTKSSQPTGSQTIHFYVEMYDSYGGCHAEVQIYEGSTWVAHSLTQGANNGNNSTWSGDIVVKSNSTAYYFHGWDDWGANAYDSNGGSNYTISINPTTAAAGNWSSASTWCDGSVLSSSTSNFIIAHNVTLDQAVTVGQLTINSGAQLAVDAGKQLTINTALTNNGTLNLLSSASGTATILTPASISGGGTYKAQQYLTSGRNWYVSSPVSAASRTTALSTSTASKFAAWNEVSGVWIDPVSDATLTIGKGYVAASPTTTGTIDFTGGALNNGDIPISVSRHTGVTKEGFNLIGNPYPSHITWTTDMATAANLSSTIWVRTYDSGYLFQTYNAAGTIGSPTGATPYISPMQGFWVRANTSAGGTLTFTNAMRYHKSSNPLKAPETKNTNQQLLRLQVSNGTNTDETVLYFNPNASNAFDDYDSPKMSNATASIPEIYTTVGTENMVINGLSSYITDQVLPLGFTTGETNNFSIKATELNNFPTDARIFLKDNLLRTEKDLTAGSAYTFSSDAINSTDRFSIIFKSASLATKVETQPGDFNVQVYRNSSNQIMINYSGDINNESSVIVYNAMGQKLVYQALSNSKTTINKKFVSGVYVVSIQINGIKTTKKLTIN